MLETFKERIAIQNNYELQTYLRNKYKIHVNIHWFGKFDFTIKVEPDKILNERLQTYDTYEECLEAALLWALKYLAHDHNKKFNRQVASVS